METGEGDRDADRTTIAELRETFGTLLDHLTDQDLREYVHSVARLAEEWALDQHKQVLRLAVYLYGARIFLGDIPSWVAPIMSDRRRTGHERLLSLTHRLRDAMTEVYGETPVERR